VTGVATSCGKKEEKPQQDKYGFSCGIGEVYWRNDFFADIDDFNQA
jgi:hypothetical protein